MSNNYTYQIDPVSKSRFVQIDDNLTVQEVVIDREGLFKGFVYHQPDPTTLAGALALFGNDESALLDALDRTIGQMIYSRSFARLKSKLPQDQRDGESTKNWLARHAAEIESIKLTDPVLFSVDDAVEFKPGERELTPAGILRAVNKAQTEGTKALAEGRIQDALGAFNRVKELMEKFGQVTAALAEQAKALDAQEA